MNESISPEVWGIYRSLISVTVLAVIFVAGFFVGRFIWRNTRDELLQIENENRQLDADYKKRSQIFSENQGILDEIWEDESD